MLNELTERIGLNHESKRRLALILQGTGSGPGYNINTLNFTKDPEKRDKDIEDFIRLINRHFNGILQLVRSGNIIVPIIINQSATEVKHRAIPSKVIALASIILLHQFANNFGPTLANLEKKFEVTNVSTNELRQLIRELKNLRWVVEEEEAGVTYYSPSQILKACISQEMLEEIYSELYFESDDKEERALLEEFLPKEYIKSRRKLHIKPRQKKIIVFEGEEDAKRSSD